MDHCAADSADYSWSHETNGSGYPLIYLNGPPPGAEITVRVGGAIRKTSDWISHNPSHGLAGRHRTEAPVPDTRRTLTCGDTQWRPWPDAPH